jgi:hypothetical protein
MQITRYDAMAFHFCVYQDVANGFPTWYSFSRILRGTSKIASWLLRILFEFFFSARAAESLHQLAT